MCVCVCVCVCVFLMCVDKLYTLDSICSYVYTQFLWVCMEDQIQGMCVCAKSFVREKDEGPYYICVIVTHTRMAPSLGEGTSPF